MINQIMQEAVSRWQLTDRLLRLTLPLLRYQDEDFKTMSISMVSENKEPLGFVSWHHVQTTRHSIPDSLSLHGLYIRPEAQARGFGKQLLFYAENHARAVGASRLELKAWRDAESYFRNLGFAAKDSIEQEKHYPIPLCRDIKHV